MSTFEPKSVYLVNANEIEALYKEHFGQTVHLEDECVAGQDGIGEYLIHGVHMTVESEYPKPMPVLENLCAMGHIPHGTYLVRLGR